MAEDGTATGARRRDGCRAALPIGSTVLAALILAPIGTQAAPRTYATEAAFVRAMARRMTSLPEGGTYTATAAARRCLNFVSGAHGTPSLRQEAGRANRDFALSAAQDAAFRDCAREEGYRLR